METLSELQQFLHAAGVLPYLHGGSVSGAGQDIQNLVLPFQLRFCLQGQVLQLQQHLQTCTALVFLKELKSSRLVGINLAARLGQNQLKPMEN